jgi:ribosomal protein S18 acetylase RimI-like enzyme
MTEPDFVFRKAVTEDAATVADLVNSAYRGDSSRAGWTTEADLLEGRRTDEAEVRRLISSDGSMILLCIRGQEIIGSVHLKRQDDGAYLGLLVVKPVLQGAGIGKRFMQAAEHAVRDEWGAVRMTMTVISIREELIAFYERRGYRRTGRLLPFPKDAGLSVARVPGLMFEVLEKGLDA